MDALAHIRAAGWPPNIMLSSANRWLRWHCGLRNCADSLRARLGWEPGILNGDGRKPKWMRWPTFERLAAKHDDLVGRSMQAMMLRFRLMGRRPEKAE